MISNPQPEKGRNIVAFVTDGYNLRTIIRDNDSERLASLLGKAFTVHDRNGGSETLLHLACEFNAVDCARVLIAVGSDVNRENWYGSTPLHKCAVSGSDAIVPMLAEAGADVNARRSTGTTALVNAAAHGHSLVVGALLDAGADPNIRNWSKNLTPLSLAIANGHGAVAALLHKAGGVVPTERYWEDEVPVLSPHKKNPHYD